ncbi:hypothetical protein, partial [Streptomyces sp. SBT349]|uniref:hypothetical protein n=1 Tax=Streptomyces sp. SBT349 TaxID=1580539 RepID=UPI00066E2D7D
MADAAGTTPAPGGALDRALSVLGCVAAEPRLGGVLFFDLEPALLPLLGDLLGDLLGELSGVLPGGAAEGRGPNVVTLGSWVAPEDLWLRTGLTEERFAMLPGALVEDGGGDGGEDGGGDGRDSG